MYYAHEFNSTPLNSRSNPPSHPLLLTPLSTPSPNPNPCLSCSPPPPLGSVGWSQRPRPSRASCRRVLAAHPHIAGGRHGSAQTLPQGSLVSVPCPPAAQIPLALLLITLSLE